MTVIRHCVPDEAVEAANAALAEERRLPVSSMRAAILAAQPVMAEQLEGAVEALRLLWDDIREADKRFVADDVRAKVEAVLLS